MQVTRMDLDGAGSPMALVSKMLKAEPGLKIPVPIEELAIQLDISEIRDITADGFVGGLITDEGRSKGFILVSTSARGGRRRFTIGHELCHFLSRHHKAPPEGFKCKAKDFTRYGRDFTGTAKQEAEANEFSALILMPPPVLRAELGKFRDADLGQIEALADLFQVSKEAAARAYAEYNDNIIAVVVVKDGKIVRIYKRTNFPRLAVWIGDEVPRDSILFHMPQAQVGPSKLVQGRADQWLESDWGKRLPSLYEQAVRQRDGYATILLWSEEQPEEEEGIGWGEKTAKQRLQEYRDRAAR
jgi:Zn-dependent peptidase ImmA (M78 family)